MNKLVINKENLLQNVQKIKEHAQINLPDDNGNQVKIIVVVKSNAYGLDLKQYVQFMVNQGFDFFAVSTVQEAIEFRKQGFTQQLLMLSSTGIKEEIKNLIGPTAKPNQSPCNSLQPASTRSCCAIP